MVGNLSGTDLQKATVSLKEFVSANNELIILMDYLVRERKYLQIYQLQNNLFDLKKQIESHFVIQKYSQESDSEDEEEEKVKQPHHQPNSDIILT